MPGPVAGPARRLGSSVRLREAVDFFASSVPIALVDFVKLLLPAITTARVGHHATSATDLAGASMGILTFNVAGNMIVAAPLAALDTIAPQAYGAGNKQGVGLAAQRALLLSACFLLPTAPLWVFAHPILVALGQPPDVARFSARYMRLLLPGLAPYAIFEAARKFVYAQNLRSPPLLSAAVGLASHFLWLEVWCWALDVGVGAPLALCSTYATMAVVMIAHIRCGWRMPHAFEAWPRGAQRHLLLRDRAAWRLMLTTSLSALLSLSEWLFWEVNCFRVGQFGTVPLASYSIAYSVEPVFFMVPLGLSTALANSVGNLLGARRVGDARRLVLTASAVGFATICAYTFGVWVAGRSLARLFTRDAEVLAATAHMWPWFCAFMLISGPFALIIGLNRGLGLQRHNAACVLLLVWPVGAPLILIYAQSPSNVWQLLSCTYALLLSALVLCAGCSNWEALADKAAAANEQPSPGEAENEMNGSAPGGGSRRTCTSTGGLAAADAEAAKARENEMT